MSYTFPESLFPLRDYLKGLGADIAAMKSARQVAWMAQRLLGSRIKFPKGPANFTPTLLLIQQTLPGKGSGKSQRVEAPKSSSPSATLKNRKRAEKDRRSASESRRIKREYTGEAVRSGIHIFCDGAAIPNPGDGGWGVVVYSDGAETAAFSGGASNATNNQMELTGLLEAVKAARRLSESTSQPLTIWSDSTYCVNGVNLWMAGWKKRDWLKSTRKPVVNSALWRAVDAALGTGWEETIAIRWVKGHSGIPGNLRADALAEEGKRSLFPAMRPPPPRRDYRTVPQDNQESVSAVIGMDDAQKTDITRSVKAGSDAKLSHNGAGFRNGTADGQNRSTLSIMRQPMENQTLTAGSAAQPSSIRDLFDLWKSHANIAALLGDRIASFPARTAEEFALKLLLQASRDRSGFKLSEDMIEEARALRATDDPLPLDENTHDLEAVITEYVMAEAAWNACRPDGDFCFEGPLFDVYNDKRDRFILFQCTTNAEVQRKLAYVAGDIGTAQSLEYDDWNARFRASITLPISTKRCHTEKPASRTVKPGIGKARKPVVVEHKVRRRAVP